MKWVPSVVPEHPQQTNGDPLDQAAYEELKEELTALLQGKEKELFLRFFRAQKPNGSNMENNNTDRDRRIRPRPSWKIWKAAWAFLTRPAVPGG